MKIQVVKKGNNKVKAIAACPFLVDPPDGVEIRKPVEK